MGSVCDWHHASPCKDLRLFSASSVKKINLHELSCSDVYIARASQLQVLEKTLCFTFRTV